MQIVGAIYELGTGLGPASVPGAGAMTPWPLRRTFDFIVVGQRLGVMLLAVAILDLDRSCRTIRESVEATLPSDAGPG